MLFPNLIRDKDAPADDTDPRPGDRTGGAEEPVTPPPDPNPPDPPPGPEPNPEPPPEGPPPPAEPPPAGPPPAEPPGPSAIGGVKGSEATGGVEGSYGQVGTIDFTKRFGNPGPASWFQNMTGRKKPWSEVPGQERNIGSVGGGIVGGGGGDRGQNAMSDDERWQRFMREVNRQRFGR